MKPSKRLFTQFLAILLFVTLPAPKLCAETCIQAKLRGKKGRIALKTVERSGACKKREVTVPAGAQGQTGPQGESGAAGSEGADGQLRIYGDGSAGAKTVSADETLGNDSPPDEDSNLQFTDVTINSGVTLTVPSGTAIRCSGTFTNNGTIVVQTSARGAARGVPDVSTAFPSEAPAHPGISLRSAGSGESGDNSVRRDGGPGGIKLNLFQLRQLRYPGPYAGGGGGVGTSINTLQGESGGGSLVVLCDGAINNDGVITADGESGAGVAGNGGGAGGIIILASRTSVTNSTGGVISVAGGPGGPSDSDTGAGGGGGGGFVHFLAPSTDNSGTIAATEGAQGTAGAAGSISDAFRGGGGGGGACTGNGGVGGSARANDDPGNALAGSSGGILESELDPTALF